MPKDRPGGPPDVPRWEMIVVGALAIASLASAIVGWLRTLFG